MSKQEVLVKHIEALCSAIPELTGVLLASSDGLPIAHSITNGTDPARLAAMAVAASNLGARVSDAIETGTLDEVTIRSDEGNLFVYSAGEKAILAVLGPKEANAGLVNIEARNTAEESRQMQVPMAAPTMSNMGMNSQLPITLTTTMPTIIRLCQPGRFAISSVCAKGM